MSDEKAIGQSIEAGNGITNIQGGHDIPRVRPNFLVAAFVFLTAVWTIVMLAFAYWTLRH